MKLAIRSLMSTLPFAVQILVSLGLQLVQSKFHYAQPKLGQNYELKLRFSYLKVYLLGPTGSQLQKLAIFFGRVQIRESEFSSLPQT